MSEQACKTMSDDPSMIDMMSEAELRQACKELSIDGERKRKHIKELETKLEAAKAKYLSNMQGLNAVNERLLDERNRAEAKLEAAEKELAECKQVGTISYERAERNGDKLRYFKKTVGELPDKWREKGCIWRNLQGVGSTYTKCAGELQAIIQEQE